MNNQWTVGGPLSSVGGAMTASQAAQMQPQPVLVDELERAGKALGVLRSTVIGLEDRLAPIMRQETEAVGSQGEAGAPTGASPIVERLQAQRSDIHDITVRLNRLLALLDL